MIETPAFVLLYKLLFGIICAFIANDRGRSAVGWFFIGFLLDCFGLILLLVLPNPRREEEKRRQLARENQRLKERLHKDRNVADRRHDTTQRRLRAHDQALGVDTAERLEALCAFLSARLPQRSSDFLAQLRALLVRQLE